jgi:hypothetical protein
MLSTSLRHLIVAVAALGCSISVSAEAPAKESFYGFGAGVDIPPFTSSCLSIEFASFHIGESAQDSKEVTRSAQVNVFGQNTCSGAFFFTSGTTYNLVFVKGPAGESLTGSGTIPVFTIGFGNEQVTFDITVTSTGQRENRRWGTNNVLDAGIKVTQAYDETAKPALADLNLSGSITGVSLTANVRTHSSIGSSKFSTTVIGLPR